MISSPGGAAIPTLAIIGHMQVSQPQHADSVCEQCWLMVLWPELELSIVICKLY